MSEISFENENQPVCSSISSCWTLNASSILMSSLSSLINYIIIIVSRGSQLRLSVFKTRINRKKNQIQTAFSNAER